MYVFLFGYCSCHLFNRRAQVSNSANKASSAADAAADLGVTIEYVEESAAQDLKGSEYEALAEVMERFEARQRTDEEPSSSADAGANAAAEGSGSKSQQGGEHGEEAGGDESDSEEEIDPDDLSKMSNRKRKQLMRLSVAELKAYVNRPDVVEVHDVTSHEPKLLVNLKATKNTIPVPRHWSQKRKYLQGKGGYERHPYTLPSFIAATGIGTIRDASLEKESGKSLKQRMRERVRPKRGQMEIEYEKLYDAFFRYQTKPSMTPFGDLYYERKELEHNYPNKRPGVLSSKLRAALAMSSDISPPPWLVNMQRFGPPPSYPNLQIPGLNCPPPSGASFGYGHNKWGKPPVDVTGRALYGDPFNLQGGEAADEGPRPLGGEGEMPVKEDWWGEIGEVDTDSDDDDDDDEEEADGQAVAGDAQQAGAGTAAAETAAGIADGTATPVPGTQTPSTVQLRKEAPTGPTPSVPYTVLQQKKGELGDGIIAGGHVYDMGGGAAVNLAKAGGVGGTSSVAGGVASVAGGAASVASGIASSTGRGTKRSRFSAVADEDPASKYKNFKF